MLSRGPWTYFTDLRFVTDIRYMSFLCIYGCHSVFLEDSVAVQMTARVRLHSAPADGEAITAFTNQSCICLYLLHISYALCFRVFRTQSCIYELRYFVITCQLDKPIPQ